MFDASAEYYDLICSAFKDCAGETAQIAALLRRLRPGCLTILDLACGRRSMRASWVHELGLFTAAELSTEV